MNRAVPVVIPAYQAAHLVGDVIQRALRVVECVVVVDDGSTDGTHEVARLAGARVVRHAENRGKGCALATGLGDLFGRGYEQAVTLDADGQHLPEQVVDLIEAGRNGSDLVIGSREHLFRSMYGLRSLSNRWSSMMISAVAGLPIVDVQSGFRLYSRRLFQRVGLPEPRFEAESAVVVRAVRLGYRVTSVPIELGFVDGRRTSHYRPLVDSLRIALAVARARLETVGCPSERSS